MAGINPRNAIENFLKPLRGVINCISTSPLHYQDPIEPNDDFVLLLGEGDVVRLSASSAEEIGLILIMNFKLMEAEGRHGRWKIKTTSYNYQILQNKEELISYHWHPSATPHFWFPHLHVKGKITKIHCPTGRISVEEIVRLLILDFKVKPKKSDWENILIKAQRKFEEFRTWTSLPSFPR